jgi:uncharacterized protein YyaL (SSP411 family)
MDRESYENAGTARLINENFIAVKVDRDERPDVDARYQAAIQAISGQGGWPLTAFLTPDGRPFYGGTYFPPQDQFGRPGFPHVLQAIARAYHERHDEVLQSAESIMSVIGSEAFAGRKGDISAQVVDQILAAAKTMFDPEHGGFGTSPKFPHPALIDLLIDHYARTGNAESRIMFLTTLDQMSRGGVYDQIGGGFHRYSTDEKWIVPHFEKMSYDNSELLKNYVHAWQLTGIEQFAGVALDIIRWMDSWLSDREHGGFYASQDADISLEDDGDYFTWTLAEASAVLNRDELEVAALHYDINEIGEMHHNHFKNVLYQRASNEEVALRLGISPEHVAELLRSAQRKLYQARGDRPTPYIDRTVYSGWNGLCVSAYLQAARALHAFAASSPGIEEARRFALRSLDRILAQGWSQEGGLKHAISYSDGCTPAQIISGVLDDYAFVVLACLDAYEATADMTYFQFARKIADSMIARFYDNAGAGFFDTDITCPETIGALAAHRKPIQDSPTPGGNSAAAIGLMRLHSYTLDPRYREVAEKTLEVFAGMAGQFGIFAATYGIATLFFVQPHTQVIVIGNDQSADQLFRAAAMPFALTKSLLHLPEAAPMNLPPALAESIPHLHQVSKERSAAIVCSGFTCHPPTDDPSALAIMVREAIRATRPPTDTSAAD